MRNGFPVYVVDADERTGRSIRFLLSTLKLDCRLFRSADQFVRELGALSPGCILYDINMPGLNGSALKVQLVGRGIDWPVIYMANESDVPEVTRAVRQGAIEFLLKPFSDVALLNALHRALVQLGQRQSGKRAALR